MTSFVQKWPVNVVKVTSACCLGMAPGEGLF